MDNYEKRIGLKTIWQTIVRRWKVILIIFIPVALASLIVTQFMMTKKYSSNMTFLNSSNMDNAKYATAVAIIQKEDVINATVKYLAEQEKSIKVTASQITSGMSIPAWKSNTPYITVTYTSTNKSLIQPILNAYKEKALEAFVASGTYKDMKVSSGPTDPSKVSKDRTYLIIGIAAGAVLALGFAFVDEIISDEVYDKEDIEYLGSPAFEITASK